MRELEKVVQEKRSLDREVKQSPQRLFKNPKFSQVQSRYKPDLYKSHRPLPDDDFRKNAEQSVQGRLLEQAGSDLGTVSPQQQRPKHKLTESAPHLDEFQPDALERELADQER